MSNASASFAGKKVEVFLNTPLFRFKYRHDGGERELIENASRLAGTVENDHSSGLWLKVSEISNMKRVEKDLPFEALFIPFGKIDFVVVV